MKHIGKRVIVTRAPHQASKLADAIQNRGMEPLLFPCIEIAPSDNPSDLDTALCNLSRFDWLILTSTNTVNAIADRLCDLSIDIAALHTFQVAVVGKQTAAYAKKRLGIVADRIPDKQTGVDLAAAMPDINGKSVFLPISALADDTLTQALTLAGADVHKVEAYQTIVGSGGVSVDQVLAADAVTFTSSSTVAGFVKRVGHAVDYPAVCIGPVTAKTATEFEFLNIFAPSQDYHTDAMLDVLERIFTE